MEAVRVQNPGRWEVYDGTSVHGPHLGVWQQQQLAKYCTMVASWVVLGVERTVEANEPPLHPPPTLPFFKERGAAHETAMSRLECHATGLVSTSGNRAPCRCACRGRGGGGGGGVAAGGEELATSKQEASKQPSLDWTARLAREHDQRGAEEGRMEHVMRAHTRNTWHGLRMRGGSRCSPVSAWHTEAMAAGFG